MTFKAAVINTFILTMDQVITWSDEPTEKYHQLYSSSQRCKVFLQFLAHCYGFPAHNAIVLAQNSN